MPHTPAKTTNSAQEFVTELKERFASAGLYSVVATGDALIDVSISTVTVNAETVALSVMYKFWKTDGTRFVIVDADHFVAFCRGLQSRLPSR